MEALHINYSVQETECFRVSRDLWVIAQRELTLDHEGKWQKLTALSPPLSPSLYVCFASLCPSAQADRHHTENPRLYHSCGVVRRPVMGVLCGCGQNDRRSELSCVTAALDHGQPWLVEKGFSCVTALLGLLRDFTRKAEGGMRQEEEGGVGGSQRFAELQITHGKKQIGLIWEHARTCARGKGHREPCCRRLSQWLQLLHTPKRQHTSDRIPAMHLSLLHFLRLDLGGLAVTQQVKVKGSS